MAMPRVITVLLLAAAAVAEHASSPIVPFPSVDGTVNAIAVNGNTAYLGGDFTYIGYQVPNLAMLDRTSGKPIPGFPTTDGGITLIRPDGSGGYWVIGHYSNMVVGAVATPVKNGLAHLTPGQDGSWSISSIDLTFNNWFSDFRVVGSTLYVVGPFTSVDGYSRGHGAAIDLTDGHLLPWNPQFNGSGSSNSILVRGSQIWLGGDFTTVGNHYRSKLAVVDGVNGQVAMWNQGTDSSYPGLLSDGTALFVSNWIGKDGGNRGWNRHSLSRFTASGTQPNEAFPSTDGKIYAAVNDGQGGWYIGGDFANLYPGFPGTPAVAISNLAHIDLNGDIDPVFLPQPDGIVESLVLNGNDLYVGGRFSNIGNQVRRGLALVDAVSGSASTAFRADLQWAGYNMNSVNVNRMALADGRLWVAGDFYRVGGLFRRNLVALDAATGSDVGWTRGTDQTVNSIAVSGPNLVVGGNAWSGDNYYVGPTYGTYSPHLAAITASGQPIPGMPAVDGKINKIVPDGQGGWFVGGLFNHIGSRDDLANLAHINADLSIDAAWNPHPDGEVSDLAVTAGLVYVAGNFANIGGANRPYLAQIDSASGGATYGTATAWSPAPNARAYRVRFANDGQLLVSGDFTLVGGQSRKYLARLTPDTALATAWNPGPNSGIWDLAVQGDRVFVAGDFTSFTGGAASSYLASFTGQSSVPDAWYPNLNARVCALEVDGSSLRIGGDFTNFSAAYGPTAGRLAQLDTTSDVTLTVASPAVSGSTTIAIAASIPFTLSAGQYLALASGYYAAHAQVAGTVVFTAGSLTQTVTLTGALGSALAGGAPLTYLPYQPTWTASADGRVLTIHTIGNDTYVGGAFTTLNGGTHPRIGVLDRATGSVSTGFTLALDADLTTVAEGTAGIALGGTFQFQNKANLGSGGNDLGAYAINRSTGTLAWSTTLSGDHGNIYDLLVAADGSLYAAGAFSSVNGSLRNGVVQLDPASGAVQAFDPQLNGNAYCLGIDGNTLYLGAQAGSFGNGSNARVGFTTVGGVPRQKVAAVDRTTGLATAFNPQIDRDAYVIKPVGGGGNVLMAGYYDWLGWDKRDTFYKLDPTTGLVVPGWTVWLDYPYQVRDQAIVGADLLIGGYFPKVNGLDRPKLASINLGTGNPNALTVALDNVAVNAFVVDGAETRIAGDFSRIGTSVYRNHLASLATADWTPAAWDPGERSAAISLMVADPAGIIVGGTPGWFGGGARTDLAAVDLATNTPAKWSPTVTETYPAPTIRALVATGSGANELVYAGGHFSAISGQTRNNLGAIQGLSAFSPGTVAGWQADTNDAVDSLALDPVAGTLYLGGLFTSANGTTRGHAAAVDATYAIVGVTALQDATSVTITASAPKTVLSGAIITIGGQSYPLTADLVFTAGALTQVATLGSPLVITVGAGTTVGLPVITRAWAPEANDRIYSILQSGSSVVLGGAFTTIGGVSQRLLAAVDATTGARNSTWAPTIANGTYVDALTLFNGTLYLGGDFTTVNSVTRNRIAALGADLAGSATVSAWAPSFNSAVYGLAQGQTDVVVAGAFTNVNGQAVSRLASVDPAGATAYGIWPSLNNYSTKVVRYGASGVLVGGIFSTVDGVRPIKGIMALNLIPAINPGDADGDLVVGQSDVDLVTGHFGQSLGDPAWDPRADLNSDGVVNVVDLNLVVTNLGTTYP